MNSDDRRMARRARREAKRAENRLNRIKDATMESVADIDALYESAMKARGGVSWKGSVQRLSLIHI